MLLNKKIYFGNGDVATMMNKKCELLDRCGFFKNYGGNSEVLKNGWITMFCDDLVRSEDCERRKIRQKTGNPPVDNMTPTGKLVG